MATDDFKKEVIKKVLGMGMDDKEEQEQEKILDSELNEIAGGVNKDIQQDSDLSDTCKCGVALACS